MNGEEFRQAADDPASRSRAIDAAAGHGSLSRIEARRDATTRRWDVVSPAATQIGRAAGAGTDLSERIRRLHDERHQAMAGHSTRAHRLDKLRVAQALCNAAGITPWQRDRVLGVVDELDFTAFGSQRSVPKVTLVVIRHVVDVERRRYLGLEDPEFLERQSPSELEDFYNAFTSIKDEPEFESLLVEHSLSKTSLNRLRDVLKSQLEERDIEWAVFGHNPSRDANLPSLADREPIDVPPETATRLDRSDGG